MPGLPGPGPRLPDLVDPGAEFVVALHDTFDFWVGETSADPSAAALLEQANASIIPTERLASVSSGYVATMGDRRYLRWVQPYAEDALLDALARLRAAEQDALGEHTTLLGTFRAHGLLIPVWEVEGAAVVASMGYIVTLAMTAIAYRKLSGGSLVEVLVPRFSDIALYRHEVRALAARLPIVRRVAPTQAAEP